MARDPRRPVKILAIEEDEGFVNVGPDGVERTAARISISEEDVGRMMAGYVCAKCFEAHPEPWPKACKVCKFPMADRQAEFLAKAYQGTTRLGPQTKLADEIAMLDYLEQKEKREQEVSRPQILLPGKDF